MVESESLNLDHVADKALNIYYLALHGNIG